MVLFGGHAWFYLGGHAWFYSGGVCGFTRGVCMVLFGGKCGFIQGACMVLFGGRAWFHLGGGMRGFSSFFGYNEIQSMSRRYTSYWNAFLFDL